MSSNWRCTAPRATSSVQLRSKTWRILFAALPELAKRAHALILYSQLDCGFCAGADLRELYHRAQAMERADAVKGVRDYLERIHRVLNAIDASPLTTIAAVHGVCFGGGLELALVCDLIIADKMARFCFPDCGWGDSGIRRNSAAEARFGQCGSSRSVADWPQLQRHQDAAAGLVSQVVGEGEALRAARGTAAQLGKFDRNTAAAAKRFIKPIPYEELQREIDIFCELFAQPTVEAGLRKFVESADAHPYLP